MDITPETGSSRNGTSTSFAGSKGPRILQTGIAGGDAVERDHGSKQATSSGSKDVIMTDSASDRKSGETTQRTGGVKRAAIDELSEGEGHEDVLAEKGHEGTVSDATRIEPPPATKKLKITSKKDEFIRNPPCHKCKELEIPCIGVEARTSCNQCFRRHWKCTLGPPPARGKKLRTNAVSESALKDLDAFGVSSRPPSATQTTGNTRQASSTPALSAGSMSTRDSAGTSQATSTKSSVPVTRLLISLPMPKRRIPRIAMPTLPFDPSRIPSRDKGKAPVRSPDHHKGSDSSLLTRRVNPRRDARDRVPLRFDSDSEDVMIAGPSTRKSSTPAPKNYTKPLAIDTDSVSHSAALGLNSDSPLSSVPSSRCPSPDFTTAGDSNTSPPTSTHSLSTHSPTTPNLKLPVNAALPTIVSSFNTLTSLFHTIQSDIGDIKELTASTIGSHSALEWGIAVQRLDKQDKMLLQQGAMIEKQGRIINALMNNMKVLLGERFLATDYDFDMHDSTADSPAHHEANLVNEDGASFPDVHSGSYEPSEPFRVSVGDHEPSQVADTFRLSAEPESSTSDSSFSQQSSFGATASNTSMTSAGLSQERASLEPDAPSQSKRSRSRISRAFSPSADGASSPPLTSSHPSQSSESQCQPSQPKTPSPQSCHPKYPNDNDRPKLSVARWNGDTVPVKGDDPQD
ncbi:hypothetical protein Moror_2447 [Moniliophthora roreri MCA 2997]|uniref:Zn(2)-C6 fungal-type domain-containing protein n=1 Tax=Moniliophthora roreri (strain MCA 2997) TaxID=1381753 RepID=V2Y2A4_MONRO|nr:hypothetical protein Moror_2447 [Moniliophthora roreri MCA 2997]